MASRILVQESIADEFVHLLKAAFEVMNKSGAIGDPSDKSTRIGPVADKVQLKRILEFVEVGKRDGQLVIGGTQRGQQGCFVDPTIFMFKSVKSPGSRIIQEEVFGPVVTVQTFETEQEALREANDSDFGLSGTMTTILSHSPFLSTGESIMARLTVLYIACLYTNSIARALRFSRDLEAGTVAINNWFFPTPDSPFGGTKQSGYGREGGLEGLNEYLQTKTIQIK